MTVELPSAAQKIKQTAESNGWRVLTGNIGGDKPAVALFFKRGDGHVIARWDAGRFAGAWQRWKPTLPDGGVSPKRLSSVELKKVLVAGAPPAAGAAPGVAS